MNNNINIANTGHIKSSTTDTALAVETSSQGVDDTKSYNSIDKTSLFHDTIQKQYRESASNNINENNKSSGNNLPYAQNLSGVAETDGRSTSHSTATENLGFASNTQNTSNPPTLISAEFDKENPIANDELHNPLLAQAAQTTSSSTSRPMAGRIAGPSIGPIAGPAIGSLSVAVSAAVTSTDNSKFDINNKQKMSSNADTQESAIEATRPLIERTTNDEPANKASPVNLIHPSNILSSKPASGTEFKQAHIVTELQAQKSVRSVQDNIIETVKLSTLSNNVDDKINIMPSQISQLIKAELTTDTRNASATEKPTATTTTNVSPLSDEYLTPTSNGTVSSGMEKPLLQTMDTSSINSQFTESIAEKNQLLTAIQSSLLPPTAASKGELTGDGLPVTINTAPNTAAATLSGANAAPISQLLSTPQTEISEPFGRATWSQAMGKQVLMMINQNIGSAEIRLNPANLGPIEIHIDMSEDQVNVVMSSRHAIVREAMEQALPRLREMLDDNGFNLADADVSQQSFAEQREQNANANNIIQQSNAQMIPIAINESTLQQTTATDSTVDYYI